MQPVNYYLSLLIRRLPLLLAGCVVGAALGWLTTPAEGDDAEPIDTSNYRATHTLVAEGGPESVNLAQLAFLTVVGDVPRAVAEELGTTPAELTSRVQVTSLAGIQALQITAYGEDAEEAVEIANGFATSLTDELSEQREARISERSDRADALRAERADVVLDPNAAIELQRLDDELRIALDQLRQANADTVPLSSVEAAEAAPITQAAYVAALDRIRTAGSVRSVDTRTEGGSGLAQAATTIVEPAAESSDEPSRPLRAAIGALIGLIATGALAIALDRLDPRIKSADDAEDVLGVPVLAQVPAIDRSQRGDHVVVHRQPHSRFAESFRTLRTATTHGSSESNRSRKSTRDGSPADGLNGGGSGSVVLLTAPEPGDGTTTCAVNLAAAFAEAGKHVVLIDADFRSSRTQAFLRPASPATLADALWPAARPASPDASLPVDYRALVSPTELLGLGLLRAADTASVVINPSRLLIAVSEAAAWAARHFDVVVIDTAPLLSVNDASELLPSADTVVLVVRSGSTTRETAAQASELLHRLDARFAGTVFNEASGSSAARRSEVTRPSTTTKPKEAPRTREALRL